MRPQPKEEAVVFEDDDIAAEDVRQLIHLQAKDVTVVVSPTQGELPPTGKRD